jgi:hypothetical protein
MLSSFKTLDEVKSPETQEFFHYIPSGARGSVVG